MFLLIAVLFRHFLNLTKLPRVVGDSVKYSDIWWRSSGITLRKFMASDTNKQNKLGQASKKKTPGQMILLQYVFYIPLWM